MHLGARPSLPRTLIPALAIFTLCTAPASVVRAAEGTEAEDLKSQADRWFDLEKRSADERNEWRAQKEVLTTSIEVLTKERATLQAKVEANELASGLFGKRLDNARAEVAVHESAHATLAASSLAAESRLRTLFVRLPDPLQLKIRPLLDKLDHATAEAPLAISERTQTIVAALTAIDLFNNTLTLSHLLRKNGSGETLDVKVLYWGLAMGYGIDATGTQAWLLTPGAAGWEWHEIPAHVNHVKTLIGVYEKKSPEFVTLPVSAEGGAQ